MPGPLDPVAAVAPALLADQRWQRRVRRWVARELSPLLPVAQCPYRHRGERGLWQHDPGTFPGDAIAEDVLIERRGHHEMGFEVLKPAVPLPVRFHDKLCLA